MLAPWIGGASSTPFIEGMGGVRSMLAFWMGGATMLAGVEPPVEETGGYPGRGGGVHLPESYYHSTDDEDILAVIMAWTLKNG